MTFHTAHLSASRAQFYIFVATLIGFFFVTQAQAAEQLYTCGMHPQVIKKAPGNCPICGMKLTPILGSAGKLNAQKTKAAGDRKIEYYKSTMTPGEVKPGPGKDAMGMEMVPVYEGEASPSENAIEIDAATTQRMNLKTALVEHGPVHREFRTVGTVTYNEEGLSDITTKYEGWIEKLFVKTTWSVVKKDEPLFEMYSPDLYNAQLNYLVALRSEGDEGGALSRAALARLQLFDVPDDFIAEVKKSGQAHRTFIFKAPSSGVVIEKMAVAGQMIKPGERIYRLADLSSVWVQAQVYEKDFPYVHEGQSVEVHATYGAERHFEGKVVLLLPQVQEETRSVVARIVLSNPDGFLRPGMFVDVNFSAQINDQAVLVPDVAVLRSGEHNTVFVALDGGFFEPRGVILGARSSGNFYEVLSGLKPGERIVTSGQFMLDSESQLREAIQKMLKSSDTAPAPTAGSTPADHATAQPAVPTAPKRVDAPPLIADLIFAAADASAVLGADDLAGYQKIVPKLGAALSAYLSSDSPATHGALGEFVNGLKTPESLEEARKQFIPLSTAVTNLTRDRQLHHQIGVHLFECPMAPGGVSRWIQRSSAKLNPFFGAEMPECGTELDPPTSAITKLNPAAVVAGVDAPEDLKDSRTTITRVSAYGHHGESA